MQSVCASFATQPFGSEGGRERNSVVGKTGRVSYRPGGRNRAPSRLFHSHSNEQTRRCRATCEHGTGLQLRDLIHTHTTHKPTRTFMPRMRGYLIGLFIELQRQTSLGRLIGYKSIKRQNSLRYVDVNKIYPPTSVQHSRVSLAGNTM